MRRWSCQTILALTACFFVRLLTNGSVYCLGVFYEPIKDEFQIGNVHTTVLFSLTGGMLQLTGILVPILLKLLSERQLIMSGGVLACGGMVLSCFCVRYYQLLLGLGLMNGIGQGLAYVTAPIASAYVLKERYYQVSMSMQMLGDGVGFLLFPVIYAALIERYGWRHSLLVTGGLVANLVVCGALLKTDAIDANKRKMTAADSPPLPMPLVDKTLDNDGPTPSPSSADSEQSTRSTDTTAKWLPSSSTRRLLRPSSTNKQTSASTETSKRASSASLIATPGFVILITMQFFHQIGFVIYVTFIFTRLTHAFVSDDGGDADQTMARRQAALVMTLFGVSSLASRLGCALLTNRPPVRRWTVLAFAHLVEGVSMLCVALVDSRRWTVYAALVAVQGAGCGLAGPLLNCAILDLLGPRRLADAFAYAMAVSGCAAVLAPVTAGVIQDTFQSINATMATGGICELLAFISLLTIHFTTKHYSLMEQNVISDADNN